MSQVMTFRRFANIREYHAYIYDHISFLELLREKRHLRAYQKNMECGKPLFAFATDDISAGLEEVQKEINARLRKQKPLLFWTGRSTK